MMLCSQSEGVVLALDLEDVLPPSAAQQLSSKIVFHHVVHLVVGQSVGNVPLQSVVRVSQRHPEPKSHDYPVDATVLRAALDQRGDQDILGECPSGEEKASEEESEDEAGVSAIPVVDDLYEGGGVDDDGVGLVVEAGLAAEEVVVAVELEAVHPAEEVVVRSPGHQQIISIYRQDERRGELSEIQLTLQELDVERQLLEVLLQTQILLFCCFYALPKVAVHVLFEFCHLDPLSLYHLQALSDIGQLHQAFFQLGLQPIDFHLQQPPPLLVLAPLPSCHLSALFQLLLPLLRRLLCCLLLLCDLCAECAFFLKHIVDHCLDTLLIIEPLEEFLLFGLVALPLPQQLHLVFQPRPPLPLQGRLLVALPLALLDRLPQLLHPQRQLLTTGKSLLHLLVDALIECVRLALLLLDQFVQILKQGVLSVEQMVGLLLKSHVLVEFVLLLHSQLLKLFIFVANEIVEGSYLLRYSTQILLILRYTLISLHILAQAFGELIDSALLRPHHKLQLLQNANQLQVLSLNLAVFRKNGIHVVLKLPDFGCDAMKVVALRGSDLGRRGGEDASV